jgi:hypothetical protein
LWGGRKDSEGFHIGFEAGGAAGFTVGSVQLEQGTEDEICGHCTTDFTIQGQYVGDADGEWSDIYRYWQQPFLPSINVEMKIVDEVCMSSSCKPGATTRLNPAYTSVRLFSADSTTDEALACDSKLTPFFIWGVGRLTPIDIC